MPRLLLVIALLSCLTAACGSTRVARDEHRVSQTTAMHGRAPYRIYMRSGDTVYVRVSAGAPDAVLLAEPSQWADVVALLDFRQPLIVVDEDSAPYVFVRATGFGVDVEGWVWAAAVSSVEPRQYPPGEERWEAEGYGMQEWSRDPYDYRPAGTPQMEAGLRRVDDHEARLGADSEKLNNRFRAFGEQGGLLPE